MNSKSQKIVGEAIKSIMKKFSLYPSFKVLHTNTTCTPKNPSFPDQIKLIIEGFDKFQGRSKVGLFIKSSIEIDKFYQFLLTLNHVLDNCKKPEEKDHLLNQFKAKCEGKDQINKLRGFYFELKILSKLVLDGLIIEKLPESNQKKYKDGCSIPDAIVSKNGKLLQVECKTLSESIGHPIIQDAANAFLMLLCEWEEYNKICPDDHYCHIEFIFDKPLVTAQPKKGDQDVYTPGTLFDKFKKDLKNKDSSIRINISKDQNVINKEISDEESAHSFAVLYLLHSNFEHRLTLTSTAANTFAERIYGIINDTITRNRQDKYPLIFCLEPYGFVDHNKGSEELIVSMFHKHYDKLLWVILLDREDKENISWQQDLFSGRKPIEFHTKSMTSFLAEISLE